MAIVPIGLAIKFMETNKTNTQGGEQWINKIHCGDVLEVLKKMPDNFVDCIITSPPY